MSLLGLLVYLFWCFVVYSLEKDKELNYHKDRIYLLKSKLSEFKLHLEEIKLKALAEHKPYIDPTLYIFIEEHNKYCEVFSSKEEAKCLRAVKEENGFWYPIGSNNFMWFRYKKEKDVFLKYYDTYKY